MRFFLPVLAALAISSVSGVSLTHKPHSKGSLIQTQVSASTDPPPPTTATTTTSEDEFNMTPYVRQMVNGQWEAGVPNYEDPSAPFWTRQFSAEGEAKSWAYSKTGAAQQIKYEQADGADGDEDVIDQIVKEGRAANNSNQKNNEHNENALGGTAGGLEKPIIDAKLEHTKSRTYYDAYDHSLIHGEEEEDNGIAAGHADYMDKDTKNGHEKYRHRKVESHEAGGNTLDKDRDTAENRQSSRDKRQAGGHGGGVDVVSKEVAAAQQAAKKARKDAIWTKSVSARNQRNGGNNRLTNEQKARTQGAKDAKDKRAVKLTTLGAGDHNIKNAATNAQRSGDLSPSHHDSA